ncbi:MAG: hypothetical protein ACI8W8_001609 [Rhodothermales bacterium]|jgi:hypothetical protein
MATDGRFKKCVFVANILQVFAHHDVVINGIHAYGQSRDWNCEILPVLETSDEILEALGGIVSQEIAASRLHRLDTRLAPIA